MDYKIGDFVKFKVVETTISHMDKNGIHDTLPKEITTFNVGIITDIINRESLDGISEVIIVQGREIQRAQIISKFTEEVL